MKNKTVIIIILLLTILIGTTYALYVYNYLPHRKYTNADFNIETYKSSVDLDNDGIDDQTDILNNVRTYIATKPKYKSKYYNTGYPNDNYGVCTDVVVFGLKAAGYDLQELVDQDIRENRSRYNIKTVDKNIDFRRVRNLKIYFDNYAISLSTSLDDISDWQGGDIVIFPSHIGIVSDKRNKDGIPFLIHHANPYQRYYEEDVLKMYKIEGHYRIS
ncbi:MAG: DUF1287 domain-containing protein [Tenericutes bacterium]|nr:DUF1287 domain-containing protein [Mycoplasmatota bacterium]